MMKKTTKLPVPEGSHGANGKTAAAPAPLCYSINQCAALLAVSSGTIRNLITRKELKTARVARRVVVLASSVAALLNQEVQK